MVKFTLPQNSKVIKGRAYKNKTSLGDKKILKIYRWDPEKKR